MTSRIPEFLDSCLRLPPETSLVLVSGVLGSSTNWLVLRYLYSLLSTKSSPIAGEDGPASPSTWDTGVVLISFLRDYTFWKDGAGKLGVDLDTLSRQGSFIFIDGILGLFHTPHNHAPRSGAGTKVLRTATLQYLQKELEDAVTQIQQSAPGRRVILVADQLDLLLATSGNISSQGLREMLLNIREKVHSSIVTVSTDEPLMSSQTTLLEKEHAALVVSLAHDAYIVTSLRMLDTGAARDVSGVIRLTPGGGYDGKDEAVQRREFLYFVANDGGARVFDRGQ